MEGVATDPAYDHGSWVEVNDGSLPDDAVPQGSVSEHVTVTGSFEAESFVPWIGRYAAKLGLSPCVVLAGRNRIEMAVVGEGELIEMLAIGCSLGPIGVWVDAVARRPGEPAPRF